MKNHDRIRRHDTAAVSTSQVLSAADQRKWSALASLVWRSMPDSSGQQWDLVLAALAVFPKYLPAYKRFDKAYTSLCGFWVEACKFDTGAGFRERHRSSGTKVDHPAGRWGDLYTILAKLGVDQSDLDRTFGAICPDEIFAQIIGERIGTRIAARSSDRLTSPFNPGPNWRN